VKAAVLASTSCALADEASESSVHQSTREWASI
jgi:hypothetical protein